MTSDLVLPSEIPWRDLTGKDLEECLYWLLDGLGARDLEWRLGGSGGGAADGGRDLGLHFFVPLPDGEMSRQKWWVEAKGRKDTVDPSVVKESVLNAAGRDDLDVLIIASNSVFSNPTRDWVTQWQAGHARPIVRLWDRHHLERLLSQRPEVVVRLFSRALSPQGKLEVVRTRFWNYTSYAGEPALEELWKRRNDLEWSDMALVATIMSECANGEIAARPWPLLVSDDRKLDLLQLALANVLYFCFRADDAGVSQVPYIDGTAYLLLACLHVHESSRVVNVVQSLSPTRGRDADADETIRRHAITPVMRSLFGQLRDVCVDDCRRVSSDPLVLSKSEIASYWQRLELRDDADVPKRRKHLMVEDGRQSCNVGLLLTTEVFCPLVHLELDEDKIDISEALPLLQMIAHARCPPRQPSSDRTT